MMTHKNINATQQKEGSVAAPIPLPTSHIPRTHSELQLAQDQLLADYQDGQMYERIRKLTLVLYPHQRIITLCLVKII